MERSDASGIPWLVMIYMAGDNSLSEDMVLALQDLMVQGPPAGDLIVAQFDPAGVGLTSQRYVFDRAASTPAPGSTLQALEAFRDMRFNPADTNTGTSSGSMRATWPWGRSRTNFASTSAS